MDQPIYEKLQHFFGTYPTVNVPKGQSMLVQQSDDPDILWITRGAVRMYHIRDDGAEINLHLFRAPAFFPLMVELSHFPNDYFFQADESVTAQKAPASQVITFLQQNPDVLFDLTNRFADAIMGLLKRIEQLSAPQALERVARWLFYLAEKFGKPSDDGIMIDTRLTHDDIAAWVGMARETVSHQIEKLTKDHIITTSQHRVTIRDLGRLRDLAS